MTPLVFRRTVLYTPTAPRPQSGMITVLKAPKTSDYDAFAPHEVGHHSPEPNSHWIHRQFCIKNNLNQLIKTPVNYPAIYYLFGRFSAL